MYKLALCDLELARKSDVKASYISSFMYNQFHLAIFCVQTFSLVFNKVEIVFSLHFLLHVSSLLAGISI
jgi:hypothetical protein